jgi:xanthine dehydrogenase accessory factor
MERRETEDILHAIDAAAKAGQRAALATVVRVRGSAYRREGARMLIREDGALTCMLSGGCLEPEVAEVARRVLATGVAELRHYDLAEDVVWGLGLGCGGTVDVYIEPVTEEPLLGRWLQMLATGQLAVLATPLGNGTRHRLLVSESEASEGTTGRAELDTRIERIAREIMTSPSPRAETRSVETSSAAEDVFLDVATPPPELVVFGAGHDAIPVVEQAVRLGWAVTVVDARAAFTSPDRFPGARLVIAQPADFGARVELGPRSYALVMNHHLERDRESLAFAMQSGAPWIGVLGPRSRYLRLLDDLRESGTSLDTGALTRVRNPVGLDIGAESADEVALSIVAALVAERRGFKGGLLDGVAGRIHDPGRG